MKFLHLRLVAIAAVAMSVSVPSARLAVAQTGSTQKPVDNSAQNKGQAPTADTQHTGKQDRLTTAKIRKAVMADKSLSMYAHNVKIITHHGMVTLKGPVKSDEEKQKIADAATSAVGADKVSNQIVVKAAKQ